MPLVLPTVHAAWAQVLLACLSSARPKLGCRGYRRRIPMFVNTMLLLTCPFIPQHSHLRTFLVSFCYR